MTTRATGASSPASPGSPFVGRVRGRTRPRVVGAVSVRRRVLDVVVAVVALLALSPVLVAAAVAVRLSGPGPVVFRQQRLTRGRAPFTMYKLRTMRVSTGGPEVTRKGDPRVTPAGRVLRRTSIDELPQLVNVLRGEMTLVGPRPETPALAERYPQEAAWVLEETPGLTGPSQISLRDDVSVPASEPLGPEELERWYLERLVPRRAAVDATYLSAPTLAATLRVLGQTARYLVTGRRPPTAPAG